MGGKISNTQMLAVLAEQKLKDLAILDGGVSTDCNLEDYLATLGPDEDPYENRVLETPAKCRNIAFLFRKEQK